MKLYILNGKQTEIVNSDFVERFCIAKKSDAALVVASYGADRAPVTLARYKDENEAKNALKDLLMALYGNNAWFDMPESLYYSEEHKKHDARTKRRGQS